MHPIVKVQTPRPHRENIKCIKLSSIQFAETKKVLAKAEHIKLLQEIPIVIKDQLKLNKGVSRNVKKIHKSLG